VIFTRTLSPGYDPTVTSNVSCSSVNRSSNSLSGSSTSTTTVWVRGPFELLDDRLEHRLHLRRNTGENVD